MTRVLVFYWSSPLDNPIATLGFRSGDPCLIMVNPNQGRLNEQQHRTTNESWLRDVPRVPDIVIEIDNRPILPNYIFMAETHEQQRNPVLG